MHGSGAYTLRTHYLDNIKPLLGLTRFDSLKFVIDVPGLISCSR